MKYFAFLVSFFLISGCASTKVVDWRGSSVINALPQNIQGSTFSVFPLDKTKLTKVETVVIEKNLIETLSKKGLILEKDPKHNPPNYFILYDYASEYGVTLQYEHAVLLIGYSREVPPKQLFKARLKIDSNDNDTVKNVNLAVIELANKLSPDINPGDKK